ncbi:MAG: hypothetical protein A2Y41_10800 [Spirochaetes bacterium GWB1_36_13]|nr:MAG: hypothetical protein A2Y41_10800 [Spirochaetes bacterium GWB1_36_13]
MKKLGFLFLFFFIFENFLFSAVYQIETLKQGDSVFDKFKKDISENHKIWKKIKKKSDPENFQKLKRLTIALYTVKSEDTIFSIAENLGLVVDTLISFNSLASNLSLKTGDEILVPNMDGVVLFPKNQIKLDEIEKVYKIPVSLLMYINNIQRKFLYAKEELFIPFARMTEEEKSYFFAKQFILPVKNGKFTSNYGMRVDPFTYKWTFHGGVDISVPIGTNVYASAGGKVIVADWKEGYGKLVVIEHKYGYSTFYGHLSKYMVKAGDEVQAGDLIALSGNTGRSTGPHLHFEIRRQDLRKNPMDILDFTHNSNNILE